MPRHRSKRTPATRPLSLRAGELCLAALLLLPPLVVVFAAKDSFRLPKLLLSGWLALASLAALAGSLRARERVDLTAFLRRPVVLALAPLLAVATLTLATSGYPIQVREGLADLWIGAAAVVGWSLALPAGRLRRLLDFLFLPALVLTLVALAQYLDLWEPLRFSLGEEAHRLGVTSLAGNPGDLAAYLVLPALLAQQALAAGRRRWLFAPGLALCLAGIAITQSLTAIAALAAGSLVFWLAALPWRRTLPALAAGALALALLVVAAAPLRQRVGEKLGDLRQGDLNSLLTGRLDGWWAAAWMLGEHPLAGVGHGAYRPTFATARLALVERGVPFYRGQQHPVFANAHNEYLEAAAEWGWPGVLALGWGLWVLLGEARRIGAPAAPGPAAEEGKKGRPRAPAVPQPAGEETPRAQRALAWAGLSALGVQALTYFPLRAALVAWPQLLLLAWVFARAGEGEQAR